MDCCNICATYLPLQLPVNLLIYVPALVHAFALQPVNLTFMIKRNKGQHSLQKTLFPICTK